MSIYDNFYIGVDSRVIYLKTAYKGNINCHVYKGNSSSFHLQTFQPLLYKTP